MKTKINKQAATTLLHLLEIAAISVVGIALCLFSGTGNFLVILLLSHFGFCESALINLHSEIREIRQILDGRNRDES